MTANPHNAALEPEAQAYVEAASNPPFLFQLPPAEGRRLFDQVQDEPIELPDIEEEWLDLPPGQAGPGVRVRIVRPPDAAGPLPIIVYVHGAGWVFGDAHTHDRLARDLAVGVQAAVVFPEYDHSPEARYPVAVEQSYQAAAWVVAEGASRGLDPTRLAVAGDSVGGNMAIAVALLAARRGEVSLRKQVLFYPVTNAAFNTGSYERFADGYGLAREGMKWFWDQYTTSSEQRSQATVSPLRADATELAGLPATLIITAENDVLRDEGEAFADALRRAGVPCANARFGGIVHDFVMLNSLHGTQAAQHAVLLAVAALRTAFA